jgi:hypothetical protein
LDLGKERKKERKKEREALCLCLIHKNCSQYRKFHPLPVASARGLKEMITRGFSPIPPTFTILIPFTEFTPSKHRG